MSATVFFAPPILPAEFLRREKRFLAHMRLPDGSEIVAHCPNTGSMRSCLEPGAPALLWDSGNPQRKLRHTWKAIRIGGVWIGVDTGVPNRLAEAAIRGGVIPPLSEYPEIKREPSVGGGTRFDLLLSGGGLAPCYVEVKNVTLVEGGVARFPDAVTERGKRHLEKLTAQVKKGNRAAMIFIIQRADGLSFRPADDIDPEYGKALRKAIRNGVAAHALACTVSEEGVTATGLVNVEL